jgi:tetratricopeptide (TPR) repeat protein
LRFRWRGDGGELEAARALGQIYLSQGRYRDALESMRAGKENLSELPAAAAIRDDLSAAFRNLFLEGGADGLPPIQAVGLFLDFKDLTPIGADGDMMVRKLARRLVDVDLLDQAAVLLKYQAENRLDGVPRAEVDTDLALIELMDKQPEQALDALNASRTTLLPRLLADRRRALQARALTAMGRYDDALEFLGKDATPDGADLRADIAWKQHDWAKAGALIEAQLGDRWKSNLPLGGLDQTRLLRCGVAFSLAHDDAALGRLRERYGKLADTAPNPAALKVALAGVEAGPYTAADYVRAASDADAFGGWVATMKAKYLNAST